MINITVIASCHSLDGMKSIISNLNKQTADNFEVVMVYDENEIEENPSSLMAITGSADIRFKPCVAIHGKYEPVISDTEMYMQATTMVKGQYIVLCSEKINFHPSFLEKMFNKISNDGADICLSPMAVQWSVSDTTLYDSEVSENDDEYCFTKSGISKIWSDSAECWWLHSSENRIIKADFFNECISSLKGFYSKHNAHLDLDSILLFSEMMSRLPEISYERDTYATLLWKTQDNEISGFFRSINQSMFIDEVFHVMLYISSKLHKALNFDDSDILNYSNKFISRLIWRVEWCFKNIRQILVKLYDVEYEEFSLNQIGVRGKKLEESASDDATKSFDIQVNTNKKSVHDINVGIYVSMHKRAYIPQNNKYIIPIQVGTALSDERFSGMLHDDDSQDSISLKNKMYCEMTAHYHVWKNIKDKDYFGFWHYRRYFSFNENEIDNEWGVIAHQVLNEESLRESFIDEVNIASVCSGAEIIVPRKWHCVEDGREMTVYDHWCRHFNKHDMDTTLKVILKKYPLFYDAAMDVLHSTSAIFCNMFIMDKSHFEEYSRFCFDVLSEVELIIEQDEYNIEEYRTLGHIGERLLAIYVVYIEMTQPNVRVRYVGRVQYADTRAVAVVEYPEFKLKNDTIQEQESDTTGFSVGQNLRKDPKFDRSNCISIMLACNDVYMIYTDVLLQSIKVNLNPDLYYDIVICHRDISEYNQNVAKQIFDNNPCVMLRFVDVSRNFDKYKNVHIDRHLTYETYYRFLVLDVFRDYERVLYLDCDMVVNSDISSLFFTPLKEKYIAAVRDYDFIANCLINFEFYKEKILKHIRIDSYFDYFQAGMILFNLTALRRDGFTTDVLFETALSRNWYFHDQDVLNCLFNGHIKYVNDKWNVFTLLEKNSARERLILKDLAAKYAESYKKSVSEPRIVHYAGVPKVWMDSSINLANIFWKYARQSPFYESLLNTLNYGEGENNGWLIFIRQIKTNESVHFFTLNTVKEEFSSNYSIIDFIYLSDHKTIITNTLVINVSLFPHDENKFWLDVKEFRWETEDEKFSNNIFYKTDSDFNLDVYIKEMDIYTGFSFKVRELQSRSISKPYITLTNSSFIK